MTTVQKIGHLIPGVIRYPLHRFLHRVEDKFDEIYRIHHMKEYANQLYKETFGYNIDWEHPRDLNEVINVLAFTTNTRMWSRLADKYRVRKYVKSKGLEHILVPLLGVWKNPDDIDFSKLPDKFVLKANNGSGDVIIVNDKSQINESEIKLFFKQLLKEQFGMWSAEPHYLRIPPRVIAEELLDVNAQPINSSSLIDYKIWCINGKPQYVWACYNRTKDSVQVGTFDLNWQFHPELSVSTDHYQLMEKPIVKPESLSKMLEYAERLSQGFPQVRVDFYEVNGKPYFGEMTFTSAAGRMDFYTSEFLTLLGKQVLKKKRTKIY
ncbi:MAG: glycosyltransferase [Bacteroidales bacterium]|nr:glycosyltransferase [Candidatus Colicola caccequi]